MTVDDYIAAHPERAILETVRRTIRKAVPAAEEGITYQMPTYKLGGVAVIFFAGWKKHFSIYPASAAVVELLRHEAVPHEVNDKGTIRFPLSEPVPVTLIERIAKLRAQETLARAPKASMTNAPATKGRASKASATKPRATKASATKASATKPRATKASATKASATKASATKASATKRRKTKARATKKVTGDR